MPNQTLDGVSTYKHMPVDSKDKRSNVDKAHFLKDHNWLVDYAFSSYLRGASLIAS